MMTNTTSTKQEPSQSYENGQFAEWIATNGKNIVYGIVAVIVLLAILYRFSGSYSGRQEQNYLQAAQDFTTFSRTSTTQDSTLGSEALARLNNTMASYPELHALYDGAIAQILLNKDLVNEAKPYITSTLARTRSDELPLYGEFSSTTLLIAEGQFQKALESSKDLQQKMIISINSNTAAERNFGDELFAYNLFRIGILQKQLNDTNGELQTWQEWMQYAGLQTPKTLPAKVDTKAFRNVIQQMAIGTFSLPDYITFRVNELKNKK